MDFILIVARKLYELETLFERFTRTEERQIPLKI